MKPMDPLFHEFSIQGHCPLPFNFDFNSKEANNFNFNSKEAKNEKPKSYNGSERGHPAHFVF